MLVTWGQSCPGDIGICLGMLDTSGQLIVGACDVPSMQCEEVVLKMRYRVQRDIVRISQKAMLLKVVWKMCW